MRLSIGGEGVGLASARVADRIRFESLVPDGFASEVALRHIEPPYAGEGIVRRGESVGKEKKQTSSRKSVHDEFPPKTSMAHYGASLPG